ncbi:YchJ family protein [Paraglaciecola sp.]|uniref:YchJ family protein n=1 Tax=Paraglaciecola sp. TaxID=1920173 RepID=UPI003EFA23D8
MRDLPSQCYCGNSLSFTTCCQPFLQNLAQPSNAEALMRSRFSAYVLEDFDYILKTYGKEQRKDLTSLTLQKSAEGTQWLSLDVIQHVANDYTAQVEFKAYYKVDKLFYVMHELSDFELEDNQWYYTTGTMLEGTGEIKPQRNDPCPCGSRKKFKKCCS